MKIMKKHLFLWSVPVLSVALFLSSCGGGGGDGATPPFSQADLAGSWYVNILQSGPTVSTGGDAGWIRGMATISSSGTISVPELYSNLSVAPASGPSDIVWKIDPWTGIISETSGISGTSTDFHGKLASNKNIIVGTATGGNNVMQLRIFQRIDTSAACTISDIAAKAFSLHQIESGASGEWMYASGLTDTAYSGQTTTVTMTVVTKPSGSSAIPVSPGMLSIDPSGFVSIDSNPSFKGLVSPDKTYMIATETDASISSIFRLTVAQFTKPGQTFSVSNLAGNWHFHGIVSNIPEWIYEAISMTQGGQATITSLLTSQGTSIDLPAPADITIDPDGTAGVQNDPTFHGTLSSGKDMLVSTQTLTDGVYMLGVTIK